MTTLSGEDGFDKQWWHFPPLRNALIALLLGGSAYLLARGGLIGRPAEHFLYWVVIPVGAWYWVREAVEMLIEEHEVGIGILMIAATMGAGILGLWEEAAALVVLYAIAEGIEELTFSRTRHAIRALLDLTPKQARIIENGRETLIPAENLQPGNHFMVRPGEAIPTDGVIIEGKSGLDESPVTGESVPVDKGPGDKVFAASINGEGALLIEATASFADNTLSRIIHLVEAAQDQKGRAQQWMERFGRRYSPAVLLVSLLMIILPWLSGLDISFWSERAVTLLVAAAPCALVISLPIAMSAGIAGAGKRGILIKGGAHLEHLGIIRTIAFDKTGTLTYGKPRVTDVLPINHDESALLNIAASLEQHSEHPLARAIVHHALDNDIQPVEVRNSTALFGAGVKAQIDGKTWYVGKPELFHELGLDYSDLGEVLETWQSEGKTVVLVGNEEEMAGLVALQDTLRKNAPRVIEQLHHMGLKTVMLTGDNAGTANRIAKQLGIDAVQANLKPDDKVSAVQTLLREGPVLMVGDGVNDAPALASATCGVAMGAAGTDAAIEAADIALMADDLEKLVEALHFGHKARRVSMQNIVFAITVLAILIPAGVGGMITITLTVLVHEASELLAVTNGLRAGHTRKT